MPTTTQTNPILKYYLDKFVASKQQKNINEFNQEFENLKTLFPTESAYQKFVELVSEKVKQNQEKTISKSKLEKKENSSVEKNKEENLLDKKGLKHIKEHQAIKQSDSTNKQNQNQDMDQNKKTNLDEKEQYNPQTINKKEIRLNSKLAKLNAKKDKILEKLNKIQNGESNEKNDALQSKLNFKLEKINAKIQNTTNKLDDLRENKELKNIKSENNLQKLQNKKLTPGNFEKLNQEEKEILNKNQEDAKNILDENQNDTKENNTTINSRNIIEQYKLYKEYENILKRAKDVFPSSQVYNNFKDYAFEAYQNGNLDLIKFAINSFEDLEALKTSPLYASRVDELTKDPKFVSFSSLIPEISSQYANEEKFKGTENFNNELNEEMTSYEKDLNSVVDTKIKEKVQPVDKPNFSGKIIIPELGSGNGEERLVTLGSDIANIISKAEVNKIEEKYQDMSQNPDLSQKELNMFNSCVEKIEEPRNIDFEQPTGKTGEMSPTNSQYIGDKQPSNAEDAQFQDNSIESLAKDASEVDNEVTQELQEQIRIVTDLNQ